MGEGSRICVSQGGFKEGEAARKVELARKGMREQLSRGVYTITSGMKGVKGCLFYLSIKTIFQFLAH